MNHHDAGKREFILIPLEKHCSDEDPVIRTTDDVNAEVIRRGLRESSSMEGKKKGALFGSYGKRESGNNMRPSLFIKMGKGRFKLKNYQNPFSVSELIETGENTPASTHRSTAARLVYVHNTGD